MKVSKDAVLRVNMAWIRDAADLTSILEQNKDRVIFLDYPEGRNKPPRPVLTMQDAYNAMSIHKNIKYFAVSNVENIQKVRDILAFLPKNIEFVPKIETIRGVKKLAELVYDLGIKTMQLDKEDLYLDVGKDNDKFF
jgi:hypothetical protein